MKRLWILIIFLPAVFCLVSCEKENADVNLFDATKNYNAKFEQTGDPNDYVFVNPKWELVDDNYSDGKGNVGELYTNLNNPVESLFCIKIQSKACGSYTGIWNTIDLYNPDTNTYVSLKSCDKANNNQNCGVTICYDDDGHITGTSVYSLPTR